MVRFLKVHYPIRTLVLLGGEALIIWASLLLGVMLRYHEDSYLVLNFEHGYYKIIAITAFVLLLCHWFDLYDMAHSGSGWEADFRLLMVPGLLSLCLALFEIVYPRVSLGNSSLLIGFMIVTISLPAWRGVYTWLASKPFLKERVYILGRDERAHRLVDGLQRRADLGVQLVGWSGDLDGSITREGLADQLLMIAQEQNVHRIIVAMSDRRKSMPMDTLLQLRLQGGVQIEDATSWLERISGKIEIEELYPSWIIFAEGFRFSGSFRLVRRLLNFIVGLVGLLLALPLIPFVIAAVRLDSSGPVLYRQRRVGKGGKLFFCYKFRTMRQDAEADIGPTWADDGDPRITKVGKFLRLSRLDEIPQLWCVLKGDMAFVGPRPERPEFVEWLAKDIPFYNIRHLVRPGITGWAQIRYKYGNTVRDAKEKLQYDLFYIKNASIGLDIFIMFQTIKTVLLQRGAK